MGVEVETISPGDGELLYPLVCVLMGREGRLGALGASLGSR